MLGDMFKNFKIKFVKEVPWEVDLRDVSALPNFTNKTIKLHVFLSSCILFFVLCLIAMFFELRIGSIKNKLTELNYQISTNEKVHKEMLDKNKKFRTLSDLACSLVDTCAFPISPVKLFLSICKTKPMDIMLDSVSILNLKPTTPVATKPKAARGQGNASKEENDGFRVVVSGFLSGNPNRLDNYRDSIATLAELEKVRDKLKISYDIGRAEGNNTNVKFNITYQN